MNNLVDLREIQGPLELKLDNDRILRVSKDGILHFRGSDGSIVTTSLGVIERFVMQAQGNPEAQLYNVVPIRGKVS